MRAFSLPALKACLDMRSEISVCLVLLTLPLVSVTQSTQSTTIPHPSGQSFPQIENSAKVGARWPGDRPKEMSGADRRRLAAMRKPELEDLVKYREFLKLDDTGLARLFPNADCVQKNIVKVDGECANFVTGASGISFRKDSEQPDLRLAGGQLIADGFFSIGLLADLGDADVGSIGLLDTRLSELREFRPAATLSGAKQQRIDLLSTANERSKYADKVGVIVGNAYAVRIVAFRPGNIEIQRFGRDRGGVKDWDARKEFSSLKYDDRSDVLAVFRIVRRSEDGSITILWKRLSRHKAPKLDFTDDEPLTDLK